MAVCGDDVCEGDETTDNCPEDCASDWARFAIKGSGNMWLGIGFIAMITLVAVFIILRKKRE